MKESIVELLRKEAEAVMNIPVTDAFEKAVDMVVEQVQDMKCILCQQNHSHQSLSCLVLSCK